MKQVQVSPDQLLILALNWLIDLDDLISWGRPFQRRLPLKLKEFCPNFWVLVEGNTTVWPERREYDILFSITISHKNSGFGLLIDLKISINKNRKLLTWMDTLLSISSKVSRLVLNLKWTAAKALLWTLLIRVLLDLQPYIQIRGQ